MPKSKQRDRCLGCFRSKTTCFCGFVEPFETRTRFLLLMHNKEFKRQTTGTGRLTHIALRHSEILMGHDFSNDRRLQEILSDSRYYPVLLFPGKNAINLSSNEPLEVPKSKTLLIILIDGKWAPAKKMVRLCSELTALPCLSFTPPELSHFSIKRQPARHCVSTIEAAFFLLKQLERRGFESLNGKHHTLIKAIDSLVDYQKRFVPANENTNRTRKKVV